MEKTELTAREKNEGRVRLLRLLQLLQTDSDAEHPTLTWNGDCYYMEGWSDKHEKVATFRVDRISKLPKILEDAAVKKPKGWSIADFSEKASSSSTVNARQWSSCATRRP